MYPTERRFVSPRLFRALVWIAFWATALSHVSGSAEASESAGGWRLEKDFYLAAITNYVDAGGRSAAYDTFAATAELSVVHAGRPFYGGLFVDFRDSSSRHLDDNLNVGAYFRYNFARWDSTAWLFSNQAPGGRNTWLYAARLRYRFADSHKLGAEMLAPVSNADEALMMFGYYGSPSDAWTIKVLGGTGTGTAVDFAGRVEIAYRVR